jgi:hypothetical protein
MYRVVVAALPASCLSAEQLKVAPPVFYGDAGRLKVSYPQDEYPNLKAGMLVENPNKERVHYLSLLQWSDSQQRWIPATHDPR